MEAGKDTTYTFVHNMPVFLLGNFHEFLSKNVVYPGSVKDKIEGVTLVEFLIDKEGTVVDVKVVKSLGKEFDEEAVRVIKLTKWIPELVNGEPIATKMKVPVKFKLPK